MISLVIGSTSQLSYYFPEDYERISSRNVDLNYLKSKAWDTVYITFSEQRIYNKNIDFLNINYYHTLQIIEALLDNANKIIVYGTQELWGRCSGPISAQTQCNFFSWNEWPWDEITQYAYSKYKLWNHIKKCRLSDSRYDKVIFIHPLFFNSIHRSSYFLFGQIFDSIKNKNKIKVRNLNIYRDASHAKFIVKQSMLATEDVVIGSGKLTLLRDFITDIYRGLDLDFQEFIEEESVLPAANQKLIFANIPPDTYTYHNLLEDTLKELKDK